MFKKNNNKLNLNIHTYIHTPPTPNIYIIVTVFTQEGITSRTPFHTHAIFSINLFTCKDYIGYADVPQTKIRIYTYIYIKYGKMIKIENINKI